MTYGEYYELRTPDVNLMQTTLAYTTQHYVVILRCAPEQAFYNPHASAECVKRTELRGGLLIDIQYCPLYCQNITKVLEHLDALMLQKWPWATQFQDHKTEIHTQVCVPRTSKFQIKTRYTCIKGLPRKSNAFECQDWYTKEILRVVAQTGGDF